MTVSCCTDEHVPSAFVTARRSNGYLVETANGVFGERTDDRQLLEYCGEEGHVFVTHDKTDFSGAVGESVDHAGIVIDTDPLFLRSDPGGAVRVLERVLECYSPPELAGERVWRNQWQVTR